MTEAEERQALAEQLIAELRRRQQESRDGYLEPMSAPGIPELDRVHTREQALERAEAEDAGGLEAGPWYMELAKDALNPVDAVVGAATGGARAAGQGLRQAVKTGAKPLAIASERQSAINMIKNPAKLEPYARGLLDDAAGKIGTRIDDKDAALRALIKGKTGKINPDLVSEVMPKYGAKLAERRGAEVVRGSMGEPIEQLAQQGAVDVSGDALLRVKRVGDKMKKFSPTDAMNPNATARMQNASRASDVARQEIYDIAPGSEQVLGEMGKDIKLKNFLTKRAAKNPVSTIMTQPATMRDSIVAQVDEAAGTGLRKAGHRLSQAKEDIIEPTNLIRPLQAPAEMTKIVKRGMIKAGSVADDVLRSPSRLPGMAGEAARGVGQAATNDAGHGLAIGAVDDMRPRYVGEQGQMEQEQAIPEREQLIQQIELELKRRQGM